MSKRDSMAGSAPKRKGSTFERDLVHALRAAGLQAERAWGSDGRSLRTSDGKPCTGDVDILVNGRLKVQAKRRKAIASYLKPPAGAHVAVVREDRGEALAVMSWTLFLKLLAKVYRPEVTP